MRTTLSAVLAGSLLLGAGACQKAEKSEDEATDTAATATDTASGEAQGSAAAPGDLPAPPDVAEPPADAPKTESGIAYKFLQEGPEGGAQPGPEDTVQVHYTGWTTDGKMFDSSVKRGQKATFSLAQVIPGWTEGLQVLSVGDKARLWIPEELAYKGKQGAPQGMLVFDVELFDVTAAPETPEDVAEPPSDAKKTAEGVFYKTLAEGTGSDKPRAWDKVEVHYSGWTTDGEMFDSSVTKGRPAEFSLSQVIPGWAAGMQTMVVGEKKRFWIPEELAYEGKPGRPEGMLVFDVELLGVEQMPEPPPVPKNVAKPPKNAKKTEKGVFYTVLEPGEGDTKPGPDAKVKVHYTGWTTDGKMFDSSVSRGQPATFPLTAVIPGWTDGLQTMVEGERTRFWIPEELAYKGRPGRPQGMLVFDVELLEIQGE